MLNISITADTSRVIYINQKIIMSVSFKSELISQCSLVEQNGILSDLVGVIKNLFYLYGE